MALPNNRSLCAGAHPRDGSMCLLRETCQRHTELKKQQKRGRKDFRDTVIMPRPCTDDSYPYRIKLVAV